MKPILVYRKVLVSISKVFLGQGLNFTSSFFLLFWVLFLLGTLMVQLLVSNVLLHIKDCPHSQEEERTTTLECDAKATFYSSETQLWTRRTQM